MVAFVLSVEQGRYRDASEGTTVVDHGRRRRTGRRRAANLIGQRPGTIGAASQSGRPGQSEPVVAIDVSRAAVHLPIGRYLNVRWFREWQIY